MGKWVVANKNCLIWWWYKIEAQINLNKSPLLPLGVGNKKKIFSARVLAEVAETQRMSSSWPMPTLRRKCWTAMTCGLWNFTRRGVDTVRTWLHTGPLQPLSSRARSNWVHWTPQSTQWWRVVIRWVICSGNSWFCKTPVLAYFVLINSEVS